jgi:hypothetical protein
MLGGMALLLDSFWRALADCLQPRVIALSFVPLLLLAALALTLSWLFWDGAVQGLQGWLADWALLESLSRWVDGATLGQLRAMVAPLLLLMLSLPVLVVLALLLVSWLVTPAVVQLVAGRRYAALEQRRGGSFLGSVGQGLVAALLAMLALVLSLPLWLIPPLVVVVPPLLWGWMTARVMVYDTLALHASTAEREVLTRRHRLGLLGIGVLTGYLGAAPALVWATGAMAIVLAPVLVPLAIWIYTVVFVFAALWFSHYCLAALATLRGEPLPVAASVVPDRARGTTF